MNTAKQKNNQIEGTIKTSFRLKIVIRHAIPGRIRFKIGAVRAGKKIRCELENRLIAVNGVQAVRINAKSASMIVRYDSEILNHRMLTDEIRKFQIEKRRLVTTCAKAHGCETCAAKQTVKQQGASIKTALRRFLGLTLLAGIVIFREFILKKPLAQNLFSPLGMIIAFAALPLVNKGIRNFKVKRVNLESFLGGSIIAAVAAGEALAALEILWITSAGELLQVWITQRSRRAIRDILQVTAKNTYILADGVEIEIPVDQVQAGDLAALHTGEKISVDGRVQSGEALVDEAPITGRAEPVMRIKGDVVFAGTFVRQGVIFVRAEKVGDHTYLARILKMVEDSLENKAPIEGIADRLAGNLVKTGFIVTALTILITRSFQRSFSVMLVMACPCATILAASSAISAAINAAARRHILIKGGRHLEEVGRADILCFDKTGTLTTGTPEIRQLINLNDMPDNEILRFAYSAEIHNTHPVALAIKNEAQKRDIEPVPHDICEYFLGKGVRSEIRGDEILVGSHKLMRQFDVNADLVKSHLNKFKTGGLTLVFVAKNRNLEGVIGFANRERPNTADVISYLRHDSVAKMAMITGDSKYSALDMAQRLNFDECRYSVMPEEKAGIIKQLKNNGKRVLMVGDGINDALALAEADIGIAMGAGGSEVAIEAADIALVTDDLKGVVYVRSLSQATLKVVRQNFWIATGSNMAGVVMGALGILSPVMAGMVHISHTLGILANSSRLLGFNEPRIEKHKLQMTDKSDRNQ